VLSTDLLDPVVEDHQVVGPPLLRGLLLGVLPTHPSEPHPQLYEGEASVAATTRDRTELMQVNSSGLEKLNSTASLRRKE
jgi:hypothetical protein